MFMPSGVAAAAAAEPEAVANPPTVAAIGSGYPLTTQTTTCEVVKGVPPYSYSWDVESNPAGLNVIINNPNSATTDFTCTAGLTINDPESVVFRCTVTDNAGKKDTADCTATFTLTI